MIVLSLFAVVNTKGNRGGEIIVLMWKWSLII